MNLPRGCAIGVEARELHPQRVKRRFKRMPKKSGQCRKLDPSSELLQVLMKLRLVLTNEFLADSFEILPTTCSQIFNTWIIITKAMEESK